MQLGPSVPNPRKGVLGDDLAIRAPIEPADLPYRYAELSLVDAQATLTRMQVLMLKAKYSTIKA